MNILIIFDLPGQAEIYLSNDSLKHLIRKLVSEHSLTACILELFDATYLLELPHFISMCMMSLASIINLEMPHVNLLNKIDVILS